MGLGRMTWIDGDLEPTAEARLSVVDRGIVVGDGAFETIPVVAGAPFAVSRHLARLRRSLGRLGLEQAYDEHALRSALGEVVAVNGNDGARLRLTVTAGPHGLGSDRSPGLTTTIISSTSVIPREASTPVVVSPWRRNERGPLVGVKSTSYGENVVALADAKARGATEALFLNSAGELCEGTGSNVFVVRDGQARTPPIRSGCLDGITRALVLELTDATELTMGIDDLLEADEVFLTSSTRDVQAVSAVDGQACSGPGPFTTEAAARLRELMASMPDP